MSYHRVLTIQDISCIGQCSMTVALPILSACGQETVILPSAVLSSHTGGFTNPVFRDLTDDIPGIVRHWQREGIRFDAVYTGYLGSIRQIELVRELVRRVAAPGAPLLVDPAMADHGRLYRGFDEDYALAMKQLCLAADVILPNMTEGAMLAGLPWREEYDRAYIDEMCSRLHEMGCRTVVLTGVSFATDTTGILISDGVKTHYQCHEKLPRSYHGTGDIFASVFTGAMLEGKSMPEAAAIAGEFVCRAIRATCQDPQHPYGVKFERVLPWLCGRLFPEEK